VRSEGEESFGLLCALPTAHGDRQRSGSCLTPLHPMLLLLPAGPADQFSPGAFGARRVCRSRRACTVQRGRPSARKGKCGTLTQAAKGVAESTGTKWR
jgi:hypothetical protein